MAAISLPTDIGPREATPRFLDWGGDQKPVLGGAVTRVDRLGARFAIDVQMPPMPAEPTGRIWVARLLRGKQAGGVIMPWPQLSFTWPSPGTSQPDIRTAVAANATTLPLSLAGAAATFKEGQFVSIVHLTTGRRYLHMVTADTVVGGTGNVDLPIVPPTRVAFAVNTQVEVASPKIEGRLIGDETGWNLNTAHHTGLAFTIEENE